MTIPAESEWSRLQKARSTALNFHGWGFLLWVQLILVHVRGDGLDAIAMFAMY